MRFTLPVGALMICASATFMSAGAVAQAVPEGQSCGGLLCDMGVFGHKAPPAPPAPSPVAAAPAPPAQASPPLPPVAVTSKMVPATQPKAHVARRRSLPKLVAKTPATHQPAPSVVPMPSIAPGQAPMIFQTVDPRM